MPAVPKPAHSLNRHWYYHISDSVFCSWHAAQEDATPKTQHRAGKQSAGKPSGTGKSQPLAMRLAEQMGLTAGPKTTHVNAKVPPRLYAAAAKRVGSNSPAVVITAALAALATQDELGPWLARQWGVLADTDPELLTQIEL
jgi:hypothetical protein